VPGSMTREQALRVLGLPSTADPSSVKRAYRRLAREHHPDLGGDPATFHALQQALERLADDDAPPERPRFTRGRPSRPPGSTEDAPADVSSIHWDRPLPGARDRLDRDALAVWLARDHAAVLHPLHAASRAPGSRLNGVATMLAGDLSSSLAVRPIRDDRGSPVVAIELRGSCRGARRAMDRVGLAGTWVRHRGSNTTVLTSSLTPDPVRAALAVRVTDRVAGLLDALGWPLGDWRLLTDAP
jgi:curved DNA-binding protein CbpA